MAEAVGVRGALRCISVLCGAAAFAGKFTFDDIKNMDIEDLRGLGGEL